VFETTPGEQSMPTRQRGFTLIELVIVVVLVAILTLVAVPSYLSSVQKSRRTDAKTALTASAQAMERVFTQTNTYANVTAGTNGVNSTSDNGYYTITFRDGGATNTNATAYQLIATPVGSQANDPCGVLKLDQADVRSAAISGCW
jgi:type IV pilus assembly protein PilE